MTNPNVAAEPPAPNPAAPSTPDPPQNPGEDLNLIKAEAAAHRCWVQIQAWQGHFKDAMELVARIQQNQSGVQRPAQPPPGPPPPA